MESTDKIKLLLYKHPFKAERESHIVDRKSFLKIFKELDLNNKIENYIILDGDEIVKDYSSLPKSNHIYFKAVPEGAPEGATANEQAGAALKGIGFGGIAGGGALLAVAFALLSVATGGITLGIGALLVGGGVLVGGGILFVGYGVYTFNTEVDLPSLGENINKNNTASLRGGENSNNQGGVIPILLGSHLTFPFLAGSTVTYEPTDQTNGGVNITDNADQYMRLQCCTGYAPIDVDESTVQIGEINKSSFDFLDEFKEQAASNPYYEERVSEEYLGLKVAPFETFPEFNGTPSSGALYLTYSQVAGLGTPKTYKRTTATNTKSIDVVFYSPQGSFYTKDDGTIVRRPTLVRVDWKHASDPDVEGSYNTIGPSWPYSQYEYTHFLNTSGEGDDSRRHRITYEFDNNTSGSPDYNSDRQYTIRVQINPALASADEDETWADKSSKYTVTTYWEKMRSFVGDFDGVNPPDTAPIVPDVKEKLNIATFQIKATDEFDSVTNTINYVSTKHMPVFTGTGAQTGPAYWTTGNTHNSNPASAFLYVLTDPLVNPKYIDATATPENFIDYESLEEWYSFCATKNLQCNSYTVGETTIKDLLNSICSTGMASWHQVDNKYTIVVDTYDSEIIQYFTPRNSYGFSASKSFAEVPDCFNTKFIDSSNGYVEAERYVFYEDARNDAQDIPTDADITNDFPLYGAMTPDQAFRLARYAHAVMRLRPEIFTFSTDIEHVMCTRWDRIKLNHDVPLFGLASGRVVSPIESGGQTLGFVSDETFIFEAGKDYGVKIRLPDGSVVDEEVNNPQVGTTQIIFNNPLAGVDILGEDDLILFGELGGEDVDLLITKIEPNEDMGATLTCVEYNVGIYTADEQPIPAFNPKISKGGTGPIILEDKPETTQDYALANQQRISLNDNVTYSMSAKHPDSFLSASVAGIQAGTFDQNYYLYINTSDGNKIYKKTLTGSDTGTALNTVSSKFPKTLAESVYYINASDGNKIYKKNYDDTATGTALTTNGADDFFIELGSGSIYYIEATSNTLYFLEAGSTGNGTQIVTTTMSDVVVDSGVILFRAISDNKIYTVPVGSPSDTPTLYLDIAVDGIGGSDNNYIYYLKTSDNIVYRKLITNTTDNTVEGSPLHGDASSFEIVNSGDVIYVNPDDNNYLYAGFSVKSIQNATLESVATVEGITGDLLTGSSIITNVSASDLAKIVVKDKVSGTGIPDNTTIVMKGGTYFYISNTATATSAGATIEVNGSRITLNANRVVVPGTVTAELLEASAINSKATTVNGPKSEINLDDGSYVFRKSNGDAVLTFDPDDTGNELTLNGNMTLGSGSDIDGSVTIDGSTTLSTVETEANDAYDGTVNYRTSGVPTNNPSPTNISSIQQTNATMTVTLFWGAYTQGVKQADNLMVFWVEGTSAPTINDNALVMNVNTVSSSYLEIEGLSPDKTYSFGIASSRRTELGIEIGTIQSPTSAPDWREVTLGDPDFTGDINGVVAATVTSQASNGQDAFDGTTQYRDSTGPDGTWSNFSANLSNNTDGTYDITLTWQYTDISANYVADRYVIYWNSAKDGVPSSSLQSTSNSRTISFGAGVREVRLENMPGLYIEFDNKKFWHYTFFVRALRSTESGFAFSATQTDASWTDLESTDAGVSGGMLTAGKIESVASTGQGNKKSVIDLDNATISMRKTGEGVGDDPVFDFDADRTNSELIIRGDMQIDNDDAGRYLRLGSEGLYVEDGATTPNVIHDLPDQPLASGYFSLGHLYMLDGTVANEIYNSSTTAITGGWQDVTCIATGNTLSKVKAGLFKVIMTGSTSDLLLTYFRPKGSTGGGSISGASFPSVGHYTTGRGTQVWNSVICPIGTDGKIQFNVDTTGIGFSNFQLIISQSGFFV